jgi:hypothetical protein
MPTKTKTPKLDELTALHGKAHAARKREDDTRRRATEYANTLPGLRERAAAAWNAGDETAAEDHELAIAETERELRTTWAGRIAASQAAVAAADQAVRAYLVEHGPTILGEIEPDAQAARERLVGAAQEFVEATARSRARSPGSKLSPATPRGSAGRTSTRSRSSVRGSRVSS